MSDTKLLNSLSLIYVPSLTTPKWGEKTLMRPQCHCQENEMRHLMLHLHRNCIFSQDQYHTKESKVGTFPNSLYRKMAWTPSDQIKRTTFILQGQFIVIPMQKVCYWFLAQTDLLTSLDFKFARLKSNFSQSWWRRPQKCFRPSLYLY